MLLVAVVIGQSVDQFQSSLPYYRERLDTIVRDAIGWLNARGVNVEADEITSKIDTGSLMQLVGDTASGLLATLSNLLLVLLTMIFMLFEAHGFPDKLRRAIGDPDADLRDFALAAERVQKYLAIKAWVSLATGACASLLCFVLGVDFPLLWGLIAFLFNFVPNIGSIIAAVPVALLALIQLGVGDALLVAAGYFAINMVIGNFIEPRVMGRQLGLSTLVVFLSMLFWGWVWGPVGMLLSVPLTVIVKIALEHSDDFRWVAVLLGPGDEAMPDTERQSASADDDAGTMPAS
jgi:predicted PurR-regulated permease PerM